MDIFNNGAHIDTRPESEQIKDWQQKEVVASSGVVQWVEKPPHTWRKFPIFNQNGSGSCVAQTEAKEIGIMRQLKDGNYVHFSATHIYQQRANKPQGGMGAIDARKILTKGATLEVLTPSQMMTDSQMDSATVEPYKQEVGKVFSVPNYLEIPFKDIDAVASTIQATKKGVMVWFYFNNDGEWTEVPVVKDPNLNLNAPSTNRHSVTAVDFTLYAGQKALIIEDSWGPGTGMGGQRVITEAFFKARNWYASYLINFQYEVPPVQKPHHVFLVDLEFGQTNDEVRALQECLKFEALFPANAEITGYFGAITKDSVQKFQIKYNITTAGGAGYGRVGPKTRAKLNEIYGQ
jgi:hypothetical protein